MGVVLNHDAKRFSAFVMILFGVLCSRSVAFQSSVVGQDSITSNGYYAYDIPHSEFASSIWLKKEAQFLNPYMMEIETLNSGDFKVEVYRLDGTLAGSSIRNSPRGQWHTFNFTTSGQFGSGIPNGVYKIRIVNLSSGKRMVRGGTLYYGK